MRTIVVGDVHGCPRTFRALLDRVELDPACDRLVLLGDLLDRGPDAWQVWQDCVALEQVMGERFVLLLGNHEDLWLRRLSFPLWRMHRRVGRQATADSFRRHGVKVEACLPWFRERAALFWRGEGLQCAHAGVLVEPLEANDREVLLHDHEAALRNEYPGPLTVIGHLALEDAVWLAGDGQTMRVWPEGEAAALPDHGTLCIDTGCGKGGALSALVVEGDRALLYRQAELDVY